MLRGTDGVLVRGQGRAQVPALRVPQRAAERLAACPSKSLPAQAIEASVLARIRQAQGVADATPWEQMDREQQREAIEAIGERVGYNGTTRLDFPSIPWCKSSPGGANQLSPAPGSPSRPVLA